ncbi:hypothetical protein FDK38_003430 [Candidozyma auris]|nr:hypothetical protein FDK38_003430 [[Candida] auris]
MSNQSSLARFAFNIYGSLNQAESPRQKTPDSSRSKSSKKFTYSFEREITCVSQLRHPLGRINTSYYDASSPVPSHHVVIGGKNYLKLLALNADQNSVLADINIVDPTPSKRFHSSPRLFNVNTLKCNGDMVACGLTDGTVSIFQVSAAGKARLAHKFSDHKRVINSLDFVESDQILLSGSQDGTIKLWDLRTYNQKPVLKLRSSQHSDPVRACQYSPYSRSRGRMTVLSAHDSGSLCKFDFRYPANTSSGALAERKWTFHTGPALSLHIHPEREYVLTGGRDRKICLWDYEDSAAHHSVSPKVIMNAYGPVMKVRWSDIPDTDQGGFQASSASSSRHNSLDFSEDSSASSALHKYDFACSYLNDDPTITVFNLKRKYIPKEVVTTSTGKPVQNFIWAHNFQNERKLWTITKSNVFVSYNLTRYEDEGLNISRPLEELTSVATAWSPGYTNISFTNQDKNDFNIDSLDGTLNNEVEYSDTSPYTDDQIIEEALIEKDLEHQSSSVSLDSKYRGSVTSIPNASNFIFQKSPKDRPSLVRSSTYNPSSPMFKSPSPNFHSHFNQHMEPSETHSSTHTATNSVHLSRPSLTRNPSQSTQGSGSSSLFQPPSLLHSASQNKKVGQLSILPSPYFVSVCLPIPLNDEYVFEYLACEYYHTVPDGSSLAMVCQLNAQIAAMVQRYRDCQVWRMLGISLEQNETDASLGEDALGKETTELKPDFTDTENPDLQKSPEEASINSDLGNICGSYDSNSTQSTHFKRSESGASVHNMAILSSSKESTSEFGGISPKNPHPSKVNSSNDDESDEAAHKEEQSLEKKGEKQESEKKLSADETKARPSSLPRRSTSSDIVRNSTTKKAPVRKTSYSAFSSGNSPRPTGMSFGPSHDIDNENLHVFSANSYSSSGYQASDGRYSSSAHTMNSRGRLSFSSVRASPVHPHHGFKPRSADGYKGANTLISQPSLDKVEESSVKSSGKKESGLTKAIQESELALKDQVREEEPDKPWSLVNLLEKALVFARDQGDLVLCSTLILLFYGHLKSFEHKVMNRIACLECLGLYVESLKRKELFTEATDVVKRAPIRLREDLSLHASKDVDMRFYCCWCKKLLTNERTKNMYIGDHSDRFGYWYCDECSRKQSNCVFCNEPCKGLTVVVSLKCGHSGHFGCLQEWYLVEQNQECPAGCDET